MDGGRVRAFLENEAEAMLQTYRQFEVLIPAKVRNGAGHPGEDGMYVEALLRSYIKKYIPRGLEVLTGFILCPAVKENSGRKGRADDRDKHSTQLDIIIYDTEHYPVYLRMEDHVVVPPEGVLAVISVKKNMYISQVEDEIEALKAAGMLCTGKDKEGREIRGPFLSLVAMDSAMKCGAEEQGEKVFRCLEKRFAEHGKNRYDWFPGYIGVLSQWSVCRGKPKKEKKAAEYMLFKHGEKEAYFGFQMILNGILSVYYAKSRGNDRTLGFTSFESGRGYDKSLGFIPYVKERGDRKI